MRPIAIAALILAGPAQAHDPMDWNGSRVQVLLESGETGGDMGMFTVETPGPGGPPRHVHADAGEALFVLKGKAEFLNGGDHAVLQEGQVVFVPKGNEHSFRVLSEDGGKLLIIVTPGGFEGFFAATRELTIPNDMEKIDAISKVYGQTFTGPPL